MRTLAELQPHTHDSMRVDFLDLSPCGCVHASCCSVGLSGVVGCSVAGSCGSATLNRLDPGRRHCRSCRISA